MQLDPAAAAAGFGLLAHGTLASTNAEALAYGRRHRGADRVWIAAKTQTAGRGRSGRAWVSPPGNLYATLLLRDPAPPARAPELSFVAGLAVHDAILDCAPGLRSRLALKWPNDLLGAGRKLAGILIEAEGLDGALAVAVGIGVNCVHHPAHTSFSATDLASAGANVSAADLFAALSRTMMLRLAQWRRGDGFASIRADWLAHAVGIGGDMRVRLPQRELFGRCEGLDEAGRLVLRLAHGGLETIAAGDIFPLGRAEQPRRFPENGS
jgi:BirA family biotin operon repressor/biotin-[acetyl-CoA-carboxylase] ligase